MKQLRVLMILGALLLGCAPPAEQQGELCPGEAPDYSPVGEVNWPRGVYVSAPGVEHLVAIEHLAADGHATVLELGLDADDGQPRAGRVEDVPCVVLPIPAVIRRPRRTAWVYPTTDPLVAGAGVAEEDGVHLASAEGPIVVDPTPVVVAVGAFALDPTGPVPVDFAAAWSKACTSEAP